VPASAARPRLVDRYRAFLPVSDATPVVSLGEGATPLVHARRLGESLGLRNLHLKVEGQNPTGSFKDRGMVMAVAKALEDGAHSVICASTGNTSASAAAYAAAAGLECVVVLPAGKIAVGKLLQALVFGARVVAIRGNFDEALRVVRALSEQEEHPITLVNSVNPYRLEGQKTAAFEIVDDLGRAPDVLAIPVGNAGNISAYWRGFREYAAAGHAATTPAMWGFQAAGAAPLVAGHPIDDPETIATAIRIGNPASWTKALDARDQSGGRIDAVTDRAILAAYRLLARTEAVFVEPASAASVAGLLQVAAAGELPAGSRVVCTVTGNGLKDPEWAISGAPAPVTIPVDAGAAAAQLGL
jgi:threonine synthase